MTLRREEIKDAHDFVTNDLGRAARLETFSKRLPPVYDRLVEVAEEGELITYGELADHVDTDKRHYLSKLLDGVGYIQKQRGEPPLDVLIVHADSERPAESFVELIDILNLRTEYSSVTDEALIDEITESVHQYYG